MALKTQGTELFFRDPADNSIVQVGCVTSVGGMNTERDQIDVTCLEDLARRFEAGLGTPSAFTFGINIDPRDPSHLRLKQLADAGMNIEWALGWSDGIAAPTTNSAGDLIYPTTRTFWGMEGYIASFPFEAALNSVYQSTISVQVSGPFNLIPKVAV